MHLHTAQKFGLTALSVLFIAFAPGLSTGASNATNWPQWRGPLGTGEAPKADPPIAWSETENIRWKVPIPGSGYSTPIVWDNKIFILTAVDPSGEIAPAPVESDASRERGGDRERGGERREGERRGGGDRGRGSEVPSTVFDFKVLALDRKDGSVLWEKVVTQEPPHEGIHRTGSWASPSPVTDGEHLIASFGSRGLFGLDLDGNILWSKDLGDMIIKRSFGEGSSPALHNGVVVVNWDHEDGSFIAALDKRTGDELWRKERDEATTWSSPLIVARDGGSQVVVNATNRIRGYDLKTGALIWECGGMTQNVVPTPVASGDHVYLASGFRGSALLSIDLAKAKGDVTGTDAVTWEYNKDTPYVPTPLLYEDQLFFFKGNDGILTSVNAKTGETVFGPERVEGLRDIYASPLGAGGRVYLAARDGAFAVVEKGSELKLLASNRLDDEFSASPVAIGDDLLLRGHRNLYCIGEN